MATTFERDKDTGYSKGEVYSRWHSPTFAPVENLLTALEGGADARVFASGMAAATAVLMSMRPVLCEPGTTHTPLAGVHP